MKIKMPSIPSLKTMRLKCPYCKEFCLGQDALVRHFIDVHPTKIDVKRAKALLGSDVSVVPDVVDVPDDAVGKLKGM